MLHGNLWDINITGIHQWKSGKSGVKPVPCLREVLHSQENQAVWRF